MSHNLAIDEQSGEHSFVCVGGRESAWHHLGQRVDQAMTWEEAYRLAHLDFEVVKAPLANSLMLQDLIAELKAGSDSIFDDVQIAQRIEACMNDRMAFGVFRTDTQRQLGTVKEAYEPIQNKDAFGFVDALIEGGHVRYESAGALGNGERIWVLAKTNRQLRVTGTDDVTDCYLLFTTAHDGTAAARCLISTVRVVCQNTLNAALGDDSEGVVIRHTGDVLAKVNEARDALRLAMEGFDTLQGQIDELVQRQMTKDQFVRAIQAVFPQNEQAKSQTKRMNQIIKVTELYDSCNDGAFKSERGTALALANAVTEYADHHRISMRSRLDDPLYATDMPEDRRRSMIRKRSNAFGGGAQFKMDAWAKILAVTQDAPRIGAPVSVSMAQNEAATAVAEPAGMDEEQLGRLFEQHQN